MLKVPTQSFSSPHLREINPEFSKFLQLESGIHNGLESTTVWNPESIGISTLVTPAYYFIQFYRSLPRVSKARQSKALCGCFLSCYSLSSENSSLTSCGRIQTYLRLSSVKRENAPKECETHEKPLFSQSQPKCENA